MSLKDNYTALFLLFFFSICVAGGIVGIILGAYGVGVTSCALIGVGLISPIALGVALISAGHIASPDNRKLIALGSGFGLLVAVMFAFSSTPPEGINIFAPYIDTRFALGYTDEAFKSVEIGMTESNVIAILGSPISKQRKSINYPFRGDADIIWWYSCDGAYAKEDFAWLAPIIGFKDRKVVSKWTTWCYD